MNHHAPVNGDYARTLMELRGQTPRTPRPERRTARKAMAHRLYRLAERLDGN
jgi:hypothetical protein